MRFTTKKLHSRSLSEMECKNTTFFFIKNYCSIIFEKKCELSYINNSTSILVDCYFSVCCLFSLVALRENRRKEMRFANRSRTTFITRFEETRLLTAIRCLNPRNTQMFARFRCCAALATEWWGNATLYLGHPHHSAGLYLYGDLYVADEFMREKRMEG